MPSHVPPTPSPAMTHSKSYSANPSSSHSSNSTGSSNSSYTSPDYSYFSPQAPFTSPSTSTSTSSLSAPTSPHNQIMNSNGYKQSHQHHLSSAPTTTTTTTTTTTSPGGPVITATTTSRSNHSNNMSISSSYHHPTHNPHLSKSHQNDVLQQFALHIPPPPPLSLSLSAMKNPPSGSGGIMSSSGGTHYPGNSSSSNSSPQMALSSTPMQHTLSVVLPRTVQPEMVTISANKGDRIRVVADAWGGGNECHYEWQISFPPYDIDMGAVHARFDADGRLTLEVRRRAASRSKYY